MLFQGLGWVEYILISLSKVWDKAAEYINMSIFNSLFQILYIDYKLQLFLILYLVVNSLTLYYIITP